MFAEATVMTLMYTSRALIVFPARSGLASQIKVRAMIRVSTGMRRGALRFSLAERDLELALPQNATKSCVFFTKITRDAKKG